MTAWLPPIARVTPRVSAPARGRPLLLAAAIIVLLALTASGDVAWSLAWSGRAAYAVQAVLLATGSTFVVTGLAGAWTPSAAPRWDAWEWAVLGSITAAALAVRTWELGELRLLIDEGNSIDHLGHVWGRDGVGLVEAPSVYVGTMLFPYWQALVADAVGHSLAGLRVSSAIIGAATVPALYLLARELFDRQTAILAAVMLASFPPHVHFSRVALPHIMDGFFGTLGLAYVARGLTRNRRSDWALAGAAFAFTQYGFEAGRFFFTPLAACWLGALAIVLPTHLRAQRRGAAIAAAACALIAMPAYVATAAHGKALAPRLASSALDASHRAELLQGTVSQAAQRAAARVWFAARVYVAQPEYGSTYYGGRTALVLVPLVPVFLLGTVALLWRPRTPALLVPLWLLAALLANALLRDSAWYPRWVVAFPAIALAMAFGMRVIAALLPRRIGARVIGVCAIAAAAGQVIYYFGFHLARLNVQAREEKPFRDAVDAVLRAADQLPRDTELVFVTDPVIDVHPPRSLLWFLVGGGDAMALQAFAPSELADDPLAALAPSRNLAFFIAPNDAATIAALRTRYGLPETPARSPYPLPPEEELALYFVPAPRPGH